jgi:hypothetical protein
MGADIAGFIKVPDTMLDQATIKPTPPRSFHSETLISV